MAQLLEVRSLVKSFASVRAVDGVSFSIPEGSCFGLLGPNGAGKTTTIEMMEGILAPDDGQVLFRGQKIGQHFREKVGIQFQTTALPEFITVRETVAMFRAFYPKPRPMEELVELCALGEFLEQDNRKLSGGQRQRMLLALAIIPYPELVFLDEPTTGLDPQARRNFWDLIRKIRSEGTTVVLTTHYMDEAQLLCDEVAIMDHGRILEIDSPSKLIARHFEGVLMRLPCEAMAAANLGQPEGCIERDGGIEIPTSNPDKTLRDLLEKQINLDGLSIHKPDLEDLFIKLTGSSLRT